VGQRKLDRFFEQKPLKFTSAVRKWYNKNMKQIIHFEAKLPVTFIKEGKKFIAYTPVLDLSTSGDSFEQTRHRFEEVVDIFFKEVIKKGTLEDVLTDYGWTKSDRRWSPPVSVGQENIPVCIGG